MQGHMAQPALQAAAAALEQVPASASAPIDAVSVASAAAAAAAAAQGTDALVRNGNKPPQVTVGAGIIEIMASGQQLPSPQRAPAVSQSNAMTTANPSHAEASQHTQQASPAQQPGVESASASAPSQWPQAVQPKQVLLPVDSIDSVRDPAVGSESDVDILGSPPQLHPSEDEVCSSCLLAAVASLTCIVLINSKNVLLSQCMPDC